MNRLYPYNSLFHLSYLTMVSMVFSYLSERLLQSLLNRNIQLSVESDAGLDRLSISFL